MLGLAVGGQSSADAEKRRVAALDRPKLESPAHLFHIMRKIDRPLLRYLLDVLQRRTGQFRLTGVGIVLNEVQIRAALLPGNIVVGIQGVPIGATPLVVVMCVVDVLPDDIAVPV